MFPDIKGKMALTFNRIIEATPTAIQMTIGPPREILILTLARKEHRIQKTTLGEIGINVNPS